eukprot:14117446-Ditylum_brightwellii.AAC.1
MKLKGEEAIDAADVIVTAVKIEFMVLANTKIYPLREEVANCYRSSRLAASIYKCNCLPKIPNGLLIIGKRD